MLFMLCFECPGATPADVHALALVVVALCCQLFCCSCLMWVWSRLSSWQAIVKHEAHAHCQSYNSRACALSHAGRGNFSFKTAKNNAPTIAERGEEVGGWVVFRGWVVVGGM